MISRIIAFLFILFIFLYPIPYTLYPSHAADSTPSADIMAKLKDFQKGAASKAAQLKDLISQKLQNKAYVGTVKSYSDTSLTLAATPSAKIVSINQDTVFESTIKSKKKFSITNIASEDAVAALGDSDETGVLIARKIVLLPTTSSLPKTYLWGQVISVSDQLTTIHTRDNKNVAVILPDSPEVKLNDFVILTGTKNKKDIFKASFAHVIPQGGFIKSKKVATPSAQVSTKPATPSAKPVKH